MDDRGLLRQFIENKSEKAFAELTERHLRLVYGACLRELQNPSLAEDATQIVFLILAQKAKSLRNAVSLAGWLFMTARYSARNIRRQEERRQKYEQEANQQTMACDPINSTWEQVSPEINEAMAALPATDREIILLRYVEGATLQEAGGRLGISDNTARMRASRAIGKLRTRLAKAGVTVPVATVIPLLTTESARDAPRASAAAIANAAVRLAPPANLSSSINLNAISKGVAQQMVLSKVKIVSLIAIGALIGATGIYGIHSHASTSPLAAASSPGAQIPQARLGANTTPSPLPASQIIKECGQAYDSVQSFQQDARASVGGLTATAHIVFQRPGELRVTGTTLGAPNKVGMSYDLVSNGASTWLNDAAGWEQETSPEMGIAAITGISAGAGSGVPAILLHTNWGTPLPTDPQSTTATVQSFDGRNVYRIDYSVLGKVSTTVWIDEKTFFVVQTQQTSSQTGSGPVTFTVTYSKPEINETAPASEFAR